MSDTDAETDTVPEHPTGGRRGPYLLLALSLVALAAAVVMLVVAVRDRSDDDASMPSGPASSVLAGEAVTQPDGSLMYVIPPGTQARIASGETVAVIPEKVTIRVGQRLLLRNEDTVDHIVGPFLVGAGEVSSYRSDVAKTISGECSLRPSGRFEIDVVP